MAIAAHCAGLACIIGNKGKRELSDALLHIKAEKKKNTQRP
jgi:hypothetical protein